ncbi:MAG: hypothetical protein QM809_11405 [Gordonia sp. (in: high G+C Gram-positive bacteria)]|uniref:hypothetical protein n=1 Tax=Gordonia sp. (in: high G+C Gram-positive bacteria) TaxID=84139 RepID=UPI0039E5A4ED
MPTVIDFVEDRLAEQRTPQGLAQHIDPDRYGRMIDVLTAAADQITTTIQCYGGDPTDNPLAAGLLAIAQIWDDHDDFAPEAWFPLMIAGKSPADG